MKKVILATLIFSAMSASGFAAEPDQGQGTVTFDGSIIEAACGIAPESANQTVHLGQIAKNVLSEGNANSIGAGTSSPVPFTIELVDCDTNFVVDEATTPPTTVKTASVKFTGSLNTAVTDNTMLAIQGTASGAGVVISGLNGQPVKLDGSETAGSIALQNGDNTLLFSAYVQGDNKFEVKPGSFQSVANFTMSYQ